MALRRLWTEMTSPEIRDTEMGRAIAVLPVAAVEQHGPHLPVGTDALIMEGCLAALLRRLPDDLPVTVLPVQAIGKSNEHLAFPGTLTFSVEMVIRAWIEIGEGLHRAGVRKIVIANSHGGNVPAVEIVARELRVRFGVLCVAVSLNRLGHPDGLYGETERNHGIHGGDVETSLMLALRPDLVRRGALANFEPRSVGMAQRFSRLRLTPPVGFGWMAQDNSESGAMGDASAATAAKGEATLDHWVTALVEVLRDVDAFDLDALAPGPPATAS